MKQSWRVEKRGAWVLFSGLLLILAYWYHVHPLDFARGYTEDWCGSDTTRQLMSEALLKTGGPSYHTDSYLAPFGVTLPFMSWGIEMSWLGAYFWKWNRDFPYFWVHFGVSIVGSYLGVGWILKKMKLSSVAAWGLALTVVLFNIPRHFKIWHHFEYMILHWIYWSLFLDAWIWQRFYRERRWSWSLEAWRALCLAGMFTTNGYFWGPLILEYSLVRVCMVGVGFIRSARKSERLEFEGSFKQALPAAVVGVFFSALVFRFFWPMQQAALQLGEVPQNLGWFGHWPYLLRPLWLDYFLRSSFKSPETGITAGWLLWIPVLISLYLGVYLAFGKHRKKTVLFAALPFLMLFAIATLYLDQDPPVLAPIIQAVVPFMKFFRVTVRWGIFFPAILGVILALNWPELSDWARTFFLRRRRFAWALLVLFGVSSAFEVAQLGAPFSTMPHLSSSAQQLLEGVKNAPGDTVLDLPFCLAGGNGICSSEQCPNYPESTTAGCFRGWHDKKVYGVYSARLVPSQCEFYHRAPYLSWFDAWRTQRCFTAPEWKDFCGYLGQHSELSAVLLYPNIWSAAGRPECLAQFVAHLGPPVAQASYVAHAIRGDEIPQMAELLRFSAVCKN